METLRFYVAWTLDYLGEMLPCCVLVAVVFLALLPVRQKRLARLGLVSRPRREVLLFLFVLFCGGLMALTLFPAGFWGALMAGNLPAEDWFAYRGGGIYLRITLLEELMEGGAWRRFLLLLVKYRYSPLLPVPKGLSTARGVVAVHEISDRSFKLWRAPSSRCCTSRS